MPLIADEFVAADYRAMTRVIVVENPFSVAGIAPAKRIDGERYRRDK
jgi:hypothetical protein